MPYKSLLKHSLLFFLFFLLSLPSISQENFTLSGYVTDAENGETLIGAAVFNQADMGQGTVTNLYGFYSLTLPKGNYTIASSYLGYQTLLSEVTLDEDLNFDIPLPPEGLQLDEVVITSERKDENVADTRMGTVELEMAKIKTLPAFMGEVDLLKTLQLLPGVLSAGEGNSGFYVRGGGPDQNLILLDDATVYNTGHLFGFFSVFNSDAIKSTTLIKGGMPARYGGRLSSVVDIAMNDGNMKRFQVDGGIGLVASRLTLQGPLKKDKASFLVSARRTYFFDLLQPAINNTNFAGTNYFFYDLNAKLNYIFSKKDRLFLSGYFGRDVLNFSRDDFSLRIPWGNATGTLRWNHLFNDKLFLNTTLLYNDYNFEFIGIQEPVEFRVFSGIRDFSLKADFDYYPNLKHKIKFGGLYTWHIFTPSSASGSSGDVDLGAILDKRYAHEVALYVEDEFDLGEKIKINAGLRGSFFQHVGPFTQVENSILGSDTTVYDNLEPIKTFSGLEPRLSIRYRINSLNSIKASVMVANQYLSLASNSGTTLPTDVWVPSSLLVDPQRGTQYSAGYFRNFVDNTYEASVELFYRNMENQIDFCETCVLELGEPIENDFAFGRGWAYGVELFLKKSKGDFNGWLGYTFARTWRQFDDINNGEKYPAKYDRPHDFSLALNYSLSDRWTFGGVYVYGTGNAITLPSSIGFFQGSFNVNTQTGEASTIVNPLVPVFYGERNTYRVKSYHRMDLSATFTPKPNKKGLKSSWNFSVYNAYNRKNVFFILFDTDQSESGNVLEQKASEFSIFPIIPSVTWNFKY